MRYNLLRSFARSLSQYTPILHILSNARTNESYNKRVSLAKMLPSLIPFYTP